MTEILSRANLPWRATLGQIVLAGAGIEITSIAGEAASIWLELDQPMERDALLAAIQESLDETPSGSATIDALLQANVIEAHG